MHDYGGNFIQKALEFQEPLFLTEHPEITELIIVFSESSCVFREKPMRCCD